MVGFMLSASVVSNNVFDLVGLLEVSNKRPVSEIQDNTAPEIQNNNMPDTLASNDSLAGTLPKWENNTADPLIQNSRIEGTTG